MNLLKFLTMMILPLLNIVNSLPTISVGGISAGCFMAVQTHFAFSSLIKGIECTAGGPFYCAQNNLDIAITNCMTKGEFIDVNYLSQIVNETALTGYLDSTHNLIDSRVWLFSSLNDTIVSSEVVKKNLELYSKYVSSENISFVNDIPGQHAQVTDTYGNNCTYLGTPFINNCGYDSAGEGLKWIYSGLLPRNNGIIKGKLFKFDQTKYLPFWNPEYGLAKDGYIFLTDKCSEGGCNLHIVFHGCQQSTEDISTTFVEHAGYIQWADSNNIILIFPQASKTLVNPYGCFDWWGYTGPDYASNIGVQMQFVYNLIWDLI